MDKGNAHYIELFYKSVEEEESKEQQLTPESGYETTEEENPQHESKNIVELTGVS